MRAREVEKLQTGDVITCQECPAHGCDGKPAKVRVKGEGCGCAQYYHARNLNVFFFRRCGEHEHRHHRTGWAVRAGRPISDTRVSMARLDSPISGRAVKLVRRVGR